MSLVMCDKKTVNTFRAELYNTVVALQKRVIAQSLLIAFDSDDANESRLRASDQLFQDAEDDFHMAHGKLGSLQ